MSIQTILSDIDSEIARLAQARELLAGATVKRGPGRPSLKTSSPVAPKKAARRRMSAAGRARIAAAQKARWAKIKKVAKPSLSKSDAGK